MLNDEILANITAYKNAEKDTYFLDELTKVEARQDEDELYERFYTDLEFGTGGIRGIIEAGKNRLNTLIVQRVTDGWSGTTADAVEEAGADTPKNKSNGPFSNLPYSLTMLPLCLCWFF